MGYFIKNRGSGRKPSGTAIPRGVSTDRPAVPYLGAQRYNMDLGTMEFWNGTAWIPLVIPGTVEIVVDHFTADGIQIEFTMSQDETHPTHNDREQILVFVGGVYQHPDTNSYTVTGTQLNFTTFPPPIGTEIAVIHNIGKVA